MNSVATNPESPPSVIFVDFQTRIWAAAPLPAPCPPAPTFQGLSRFISNETGCSPQAANDVLEVLLEVFGIDDISQIPAQSGGVQPGW